MLALLCAIEPVRVLRFFVVLAAIAFLWGCKTIPEGRSAVNDVTVRGADKVSESDVEEKIATSPSPKFLGLFRGVVYEYAVFDRFVLQRDLARVEALYRDKGYWNAHARAGRIHHIDESHVRVEIVVEEGEPVVVGAVDIQGLDGIDAEVVKRMKKTADRDLPPREPFDQERFEKAKGDLTRDLKNAGHAYAKVESDATVDIVTHRADVVFSATPGDKYKFGKITIEGLGELPDAPVRRAIDIDEGEPFSQSALDDAQQALLDLGVFASVEIVADLTEPPPENHVVNVKVKLEPTRLRTIKLGGGIEFDALKTDVHGIVGWENRNFLGGMRTFSVNFRPGVVLYPLRVNNLEAPTNLLPEERLRVELRQPGFLEARTTGFIRPQFDVYPVLLNPNPPPNAPVLGYGDFRGAVGVERTFGKLFTTLAHNVQLAVPFPYLGPRDPTLETILLSYPELYTAFDFRNDKVHPRRGVFLANTLQVAGNVFGGDGDDVKVQPDVRGYVPISKRVVFAARASLGFLFAQNYGEAIRNRNATFANPADRTRDYQITFFRGFFSGGPTTNRGYALRGVGPYDVVPFLTPEAEAAKINSQCGDDCRVPTGGFTLWEASTEVRFDITGPLSGATFCDASDVSPQQADIRLKHLHLSCGLGARYDTPAGPIRLDVGYRIPGLQVLGGLTPDEREPATFAFGIPIAVSLGIGEAY